MPNVRVTLSTAFFFVAIAVGGGGSPSPASELVVQLAALIVLAAATWFERVRNAGGTSQSSPSADKGIVIAAMVLLAVPLMQLIPLPPGLWQILPGRAAEIDSLILIGGADAWMPISIVPERTLASALSLIPPMVMLFLVVSMSVRERSWLLMAIVLAGLVTALIGGVQVVSDGAWLRMYDNRYESFATGFQANRNATADILVIALVALLAIAASGPRWLAMPTGRIVAASVGLLLCVGVLLTGSRAGFALLAGVLALGAMLLIGAGRARRSLPLILGVVLAVGMAGSIALLTNDRIGRTLNRFSDQGVTRYELWTDTWFAIGQYWPVGSGVGTFERAVVAVERLEAVDQSRPNRAHNDFMEFALEAGLVGMALLIAAVLAIIVRAVGIIRRHGASPPGAQAAFALVSLFILATHSLLDYPLRSMSLACIAALCVGMLSLQEVPRRERPHRKGVA